MEGTKFVWQRPNDLNHPCAYFEISLDNEIVAYGTDQHHV